MDNAQLALHKNRHAVRVGHSVRGGDCASGMSAAKAGVGREWRRTNANDGDELEAEHGCLRRV